MAIECMTVFIMSTKSNSPVARRQIWIGLVDMVPRAGNDFFDGGKGAVAYVLAMAENEGGYLSELRAALEHYGLELVSVEELEPLEERMKRKSLSDALLAKADEVKETGKLRFGEFHVYESEDECADSNSVEEAEGQSS